MGAVPHHQLRKEGRTRQPSFGFLDWFRNDNLERRVEQLERHARVTDGKVRELLSNSEDFAVLLGELNEVTNELAEDIDALMSRDDMPLEVILQLRPIVDKLKGVAAEYPVEPDGGDVVVEPGVTDETGDGSGTVTDEEFGGFPEEPTETQPDDTVTEGADPETTQGSVDDTIDGTMEEGELDRLLND